MNQAKSTIRVAHGNIYPTSFFFVLFQCNYEYMYLRNNVDLFIRKVGESEYDFKDPKRKQLKYVLFKEVSKY